MPRIYLTSEDKIIPSENNLVNLGLADGTEHQRLEPRRLFPISICVAVSEETGVPSVSVKVCVSNFP